MESWESRLHGISSALSCSKQRTCHDRVHGDAQRDQWASRSPPPPTCRLRRTERTVLGTPAAFAGELSSRCGRRALPHPHKDRGRNLGGARPGHRPGRLGRLEPDARRRRFQAHSQAGLLRDRDGGSAARGVGFGSGHRGRRRRSGGFGGAQRRGCAPGRSGAEPALQRGTSRDHERLRPRRRLELHLGPPRRHSPERLDGLQRRHREPRRAAGRSHRPRRGRSRAADVVLRTGQFATESSSSSNGGEGRGHFGSTLPPRVATPLRHGVARVAGGARPGAGLGEPRRTGRSIGSARDRFRAFDAWGTRDLCFGETSAIDFTGRFSSGTADDYPDTSGGPVYGSGALRHTDRRDVALTSRAGWGKGRRSHVTLGVSRRDLDSTSPEVGPSCRPPRSTRSSPGCASLTRRLSCRARRPPSTSAFPERGSGA